MEALDSAVWDLSTVRDVLGGDIGADTSDEIRLLRATAGVQIESPDQVVQIAADTQAAVTRRDDLAGTDAQRAAALADLLKRAIRFHDDHHAPDCPVCGTAGVLDEAWYEQAEASIAQLETQAAAVRTADKQVAEAFTSFREASRMADLAHDALSDLGIEVDDVVAAHAKLSEALDAADDHHDAGASHRDVRRVRRCSST